MRYIVACFSEPLGLTPLIGKYFKNPKKSAVTYRISLRVRDVIF